MYFRRYTMHNYFPSAIILLVILVVGIKSTIINYSLLEDFFFKKRRTTFDRIAEHGYPVEQHHIVTEDGYILGIFRIPYSHKLQNQNQSRPIVLLQHGLMAGSDAWIFVGPNQGLPYQLADSGFDVWLGNGRGNTYSRNHTSLSPHHPYFWRFSWHEIGYYDIAAMIDYALATNGQGQKSIHYVGHSQGTTVFFTLMSLRPEYNAKIKTSHMLAPVAIMSHMKNRLVRILSSLFGYMNFFSFLVSDSEFLPYNGFILTIFSKICDSANFFRPACLFFLKTVFRNPSWNKTVLAEGIGVQPAGCSTNQILHYLQEHRSGRFRQFDYGLVGNWKFYGMREPPEYPVENITSEVHFWYSDNDVMTEVRDVIALAKRLPNVILHHIEDPEFDHDDFMLSLELCKYIIEPIMEILSDCEPNYAKSNLSGQGITCH